MRLIRAIGLAVLALMPMGYAHASDIRIRFLANASIELTDGKTQPSFVYEESALDVLFITPWLLGASMDTKIPLPASKIVVYHHRGPPKWECGFCTIPEQGDQIELPD